MSKPEGWFSPKVSPGQALYRSKPRKKDRWPNCIRPGDIVKVIDPRFVTRVGYPLCADDLMVEAEKTLVEKGIVPPFSKSVWGQSPDRRRDEWNVIRKYAVLLLRKKGWGGDDRSLFFLEKPEYKDLEVVVDHKRIAKTGKRFAPHVYRSSGWDGDDYDYEPGGLGDEKTHILLSVCYNGSFRAVQDYLSPEDFPRMPWSQRDRNLVIPAAHVVKVPNGSQD